MKVLLNGWLLLSIAAMGLIFPIGCSESGQSQVNKYPNGDSDIWYDYMVTGTKSLDAARWANAEKALQHAEEFASSDNEQCQTQDRLGALYLSLGAWDKSEIAFRKSLDLAENGVGCDRSDIALASHNVATLLQKTDRNEEAIALYEKVISIYEKWDKNDKKTRRRMADAYTSLGVAHDALGDLGIAEEKFDAALKIYHECYGDNCPQSATLLNNLASLYRDTNRFDEAEELFRQAIALDEVSLGKDHPEVATTLCQYGTLLEQLSRYEQAEECYRRALAIDTSAFEENHVEVADVKYLLASLLFDLDRLVEARDLYSGAIKVYASHYNLNGEVPGSLRESVWEYARILEADGVRTPEIKAELVQHGVRESLVDEILDDITANLDDITANEDDK